MSMYNAYPLHQVLLRRIAVVLVGVLALPVMFSAVTVPVFTAICTVSG